MRNFARVSLVMAGSAALVGSMALPASAADTTTTVTVSGGEISIGAPTAGAGTIIPGGSATIQLETIQVTDLRAGTTPWVASANLGSFVTGEPAITLVPESTTYIPGTAILTGEPTMAPPAEVVLTEATPAAVQTAMEVLGNNTATWDATLTVKTPAQALAGEYVATLTHSVL